MHLSEVDSVKLIFLESPKSSFKKKIYSNAVLRNAMFCSQNMPKHKEMVHLLQSISIQSLNNDSENRNCILETFFPWTRQT